MDKWWSHMNWAMDLRFLYGSENFSSNCCWSPLPLRLILFIPFPWKDVHNQLVVQCRLSSTWSPVFLLNRTHTLLTPLRLFAVTVACRGSFHSKFKISCPFSLSLAVPEYHNHLDVLFTFRSTRVFYGEESLDPHTTLNQEGHLLSAVRDCLFSIVTATVHIWRPSPPFADWTEALPWWQVTI